MAAILAGEARLAGKSEDIALLILPPFRTVDVLKASTNFSSPGSPCEIQGFFVSCCQKSWSLKNLFYSQIAIDHSKSENPRPTGRGGTAQVVGEGILRTENKENCEFRAAPHPAIRPSSH